MTLEAARIRRLVTPARAGWMLMVTIALAAQAATGAPASAATSNPDAGLGSVSCTSSSQCLATGGRGGNRGETRTLAELWNGSAWTAQFPLNPRDDKDDILNSVACGSASECFAAGQIGAGLPGTLLEMWNGHFWSLLQVGDPKGAGTSLLISVSCAGASACFTVGDQNNNTDVMPTALVEHWNGTGWTEQTTPNPANSTAVGLSGVSCAAPANCTAVGDYGLPRGVQRTLAEHWNGTSWTIQATPSPAAPNEPSLDHVSCSGSDCMALGSTLSTPFSESFNGQKWSIVDLAAPSGGASFQLYGIDCPSPSDCYAVGSQSTTPGTAATLIEHWNGSSWTIVSSPSPAGTAGLFGVSCTSTTSCMAVGSSTQGQHVFTLTMQLANGTWTIVPSPSPG